MSESKARLRELIEHYKLEAQRYWERIDELRSYYHEEIARLTKKHSESVEFHKARYRELAEAIENVYGISVDTLLKADAFKRRQAQAAELMDAYTEAINGPEPKLSRGPEDKPKGKN